MRPAPRTARATSAQTVTERIRIAVAVNGTVDHGAWRERRVMFKVDHHGRGNDA